MLGPVEPLKKFFSLEVKSMDGGDREHETETS